MPDLAGKENNAMRFSRHSQRVGILDFYESLSLITKFHQVLSSNFKELQEVHKPESGLMTSLLHLCFF